MWERALHHFIPTPHQGTGQPPESASDTGKFPQEAGSRTDACSHTRENLPWHHLRDRKPARSHGDCVEGGPHHEGSADRHAEQVRGLGLHPPLTCPQTPATADGPLGRGVAMGSRALRADGKSQRSERGRHYPPTAGECVSSWRRVQAPTRASLS